MSSSELVLGLDPGLKTGFALFKGISMVASGAIDGGVDGFIDWAREREPSSPIISLIVCERFVPEVGLGGMSQAYSLEVQGSARTFGRLWSAPVELQLRSDKASLFGQEQTGDKGATERREWLAARGLAFDTDHAMDAATHVLVNMRRKRRMDFWGRYFR